jgi:hypothetical protein
MKRPEYILRLRVDPMGDYDPDGIVRLRRALKCPGRSFGLSAVSVLPAPESPESDRAGVERRERFARWTAEIRKRWVDSDSPLDDTTSVGAADDATDNGSKTQNGESQSCKTRH